MHRFHCLLFRDPSHGLEHWFFSPFGKPQSHCSSHQCTILANGVYLPLPMSNPSLKCYSQCMCGNLKCICNHHGCNSTCLCTFCQFLESWSVWLLADHLIICSIDDLLQCNLFLTLITNQGHDPNLCYIGVKDLRCFCFYLFFSHCLLNCFYPLYPSPLGSNCNAMSYFRMFCLCFFLCCCLVLNLFLNLPLHLTQLKCTGDYSMWVNMMVMVNCYSKCVEYQGNGKLLV
jgi:hypothetical protein